MVPQHYSTFPIPKGPAGKLSPTAGQPARAEQVPPGVPLACRISRGQSVPITVAEAPDEEPTVAPTTSDPDPSVSIGLPTIPPTVGPTVTGGGG